MMRITHRILILVLVTTVLSTLTNFFLTRYQNRVIYKDSEKLLALTLVQSLRDAIVQDVIDNNKLRVTNLLKKLTTYENPIDFLYVTDNEGKIFAHSFDQGFPRFLIDQSFAPELNQVGMELVNKFQTQDAQVIYEYREILVPGLDTSLHIGINQTHITETLAENTRFTLATSFGISIVALLIALFWGRQLTEPLTRFAEQIRRFGSGKTPNFSEFDKADPDIRQLTTSFQAASDDRRHALEALREREQDLDITLNSIGDAVVATDAKGKITRMNAVAQKLTGWSFEEAKGLPLKRVFPIIDASTREDIENPVDKVINSGEIIYLSNHTTLIAKDGTEYQIADSAAPIRNKDNEITGIVLVFNNVTEQYKLREEAEKNRRNLQAIMNHSPTSIYVKDLEGRFTFVNHQFETLFQVNLNNIMGKTAEETLPPEIATIMHENDKMVMTTKHSLVTRVVLPHGNESRTYSSTKFPLINDKREIYAICDISTDITEREQQEEQLRRTQKMDALGKLTGGIAHDYNNMLGVIVGYSELLELSLKNEPELLEYVNEIRHAGERGGKLTRKLLSFSRKTVSEADIVNINELLQDEEQMLQKTITPRIQLNLNLENKIWPLYLDSGELEDSIVNLTINAMHSIEGSGKINIETHNLQLPKTISHKLQLPEGDYVVLSVADTGCGMDEQTKEKIFEPFFSTKGEKGTGLGLSQVYSFVTRNGGGIEVFTKQGHGSRFVLYFPRCTRTEDIVFEKTQENNNDLKGTETILVVDDEPALLDICAEFLEPHGYRVIKANSAQQALNVLAQQKIDLMLSDVIMPNMDGYELTSIVQNNYPQVKVALVSGFSDDRNIELVSGKLIDNILRKPYDSRTLLKNIRSILGQNSKASV